MISKIMQYLSFCLISLNAMQLGPFNHPKLQISLFLWLSIPFYISISHFKKSVICLWAIDCFNVAIVNSQFVLYCPLKTMGLFPLTAFKILFFVSDFKQFHSDVTKCGLLGSYLVLGFINLLRSVDWCVFSVSFYSVLQFESFTGSSFYILIISSVLS